MTGGREERVKNYRIKHSFEQYVRNTLFLIFSAFACVVITGAGYMLGGLIGSIIGKRYAGLIIGMIIFGLIGFTFFFYMLIIYIKNIRLAIHYARARERKHAIKGNIIRVVSSGYFQDEDSAGNDYSYVIEMEHGSSKQVFTSRPISNYIEHDDCPVEVRVYKYKDEYFAGDLVKFPVVRYEVLQKTRIARILGSVSVMSIIILFFAGIAFLMLDATGIFAYIAN